MYDDKEKVIEEVPLPAVFKAPIRPDIVNFVHQNISKNKRQAYAVNIDAGLACLLLILFNLSSTYVYFISYCY